MMWPKNDYLPIDLNIKLHLDICKRYIFTVLASCHARIGLHMFVCLPPIRREISG